MEHGSGDGTLVVKLDHGESLFEALGKALEQAGVSSAGVWAGVGMLRDAEVGYFRDGEYETVVLAEPQELVSLQGSVATGPAGERVIHLHAGLAGSDHILRGGHLLRATVWMQNEIFVRTLKRLRLVRRPAPELGLNVLHIAGRSTAVLRRGARAPAHRRSR